MYCVIKCIVRGHKACVKNTDLRHPSCTVVMYKHKSASPVLNVLSEQTVPTRALCGVTDIAGRGTCSYGFKRGMN
jgi:hypothetical protein